MKIPDEDKLYYHIPRGLFIQQNYNFDDVPPHAFTPQGDGNLSVNWEKFCPTALDCLKIPSERYPAGKTSKTHGIGHFVAGEVRNCDFSKSMHLAKSSLDVIYSKSKNNLAHSHISGIPPNRPRFPFNEMRVKLKSLFKKWDIEPDSE